MCCTHSQILHYRPPSLFTFSVPSSCITFVMRSLHHLFYLLALSSFPRHSFMSSSSDHSNLSHPMPYRTACLQYSHLTHTPSRFYLLFTRARTLSSRCPFLLAFRFLSRDVELNPGSASITLGTLNIRSFYTVFILVLYLISLMPTTLTFSVSLKLG